jgi:hypothetical protein
MKKSLSNYPNNTIQNHRGNGTYDYSHFVLSKPNAINPAHAHLMKDRNPEAVLRLENAVLGKDGSRKAKRGYGLNRNPLNLLVGTPGFEPGTPTVSR